MNPLANDEQLSQSPTPAFWNEWMERGIVHQTTHPHLGAWLSDRVAKPSGVIVYAGFDPTAESLHIGGLMPVLGLRRFKAIGAKPIALVGGATGMIGDPSGKSAERNLLDNDAIAHNVAGIGKQLETLLEGKVGQDFLLVNNADWLGSMKVVEFLRDVGKFFSVNMMMAKESVRARLEDRDQGISYTEFSYMLFQAYDYFHLHKAFGCNLQIGGSDQWGNITAGLDLIQRKSSQADVQGMTMPLITMADGRKFGKSEKGNIWLDAKRTHPYFLYKYFFDLPDREVGKLLRFLTLVDLADIAQVEQAMLSAPEKREGQRRLALEMASIVHGNGIARACADLETSLHAENLDLFEASAKTLKLLDPKDLPEGTDPTSLPVLHKPADMLAGEGVPILDLAVDAGLFKSKGEVRREIQSGQGGLVVAGQPVTDVNFKVSQAILGNRQVLLIRKGKRQKRMICFG